MRLYTKPRLSLAVLLRPADEMAFHRTEVIGRIRTEAGYLDADLSDSVAWCAVHSVNVDEDTHQVTIRHTLGELTLRRGEHVITREVIQIDPWSYVLPAETAVQ